MGISFSGWWDDVTDTYNAGVDFVKGFTGTGDDEDNYFQELGSASNDQAIQSQKTQGQIDDELEGKRDIQDFQTQQRVDEENFQKNEAGNLRASKRGKIRLGSGNTSRPSDSLGLGTNAGAATVTGVQT